MKRKEKTRADYMREILDDYLAAHGNLPVDPNDIFRWARRNGRWEPATRSLLKQFKDELQRAARKDYYIDPQGRAVRRKHAVVLKEGDKQHSLWADIEPAPPEHMKLSLQQRRRGCRCLGDVKQLKTDMDSYNENNNPGEPIQMSFDFDQDLREMEEEGTYPDAPPEDEEEDEEDED